MSNNKTLHLPGVRRDDVPTAGRPVGVPTNPSGSPPPDFGLPPVGVASAEQVAAFLKANGLMVVAAPAEGGSVVPAIVQDTTLNNPVESVRPDLSRLPPPGERASAPVQLPARVWGQPRYLSA